MKHSTEGRTLSFFSVYDVAEVNLCSLNSTLNAELDSGQHVDSSLLLQTNGQAADSEKLKTNPGVDSLERRSKISLIASTKSDSHSSSARSLDKGGNASGYVRTPSRRASLLNLFLDSLPWIVALVWIFVLWINGQ